MEIKDLKKKLNDIISKNASKNISDNTSNIYGTLLASSPLSSSLESEFSESENKIIFEVENRTINSPVLVEDIVVENDNLSNTITFRLARYFDNVDLSIKAIKINYVNALGESNSTIAKNLQIDDFTFTFDWALESAVASKSGTVKFSIECYEVNSNDEKIYVWQTKPKELKVEPTIKVIGDALPVEYSSQISFLESSDNNTVYQELKDVDLPIYVVNRTIEMPKTSDIAVSKDTLSQILTFCVPRYFNGVDLSEKIIAIKYINADGLGDRSPISNMVVSDMYIYVGWALDSKVTIKNGTVRFAIEIFGYIDNNGNNDFFCWQTKESTLQIEKSLDVDGAIVNPDPSWMQKWILDAEKNISQMEEIRDETKESIVDFDVGADERLEEYTIGLNGKLADYDNRLDEFTSGLNEKLSEYDGKLAIYDSDLNNKLAGYDNKLLDYTSNLNSKFENYDNKLKGYTSDLNDKFESYDILLDGKLENYDNKLVAYDSDLNDKLTNYDNKLDEYDSNLNDKFQNYDNKLEDYTTNLEQKFEEHNTALSEKIENFDSKLNDYSSNIDEKLENYTGEIEAIIDDAKFKVYGSEIHVNANEPDDWKPFQFWYQVISENVIEEE